MSINETGGCDLVPKLNDGAIALEGKLLNSIGGQTSKGRYANMACSNSGNRGKLQFIYNQYPKVTQFYYAV